jgi:hypothetical protein
VIHQERVHPEFVDGCPACRWSSVSLAAQAIPSRRPEVAHTERKEERLTKDMAAYRDLRRQGYQPPQVGGSHDRMRTARTALDIQMPHPSKNKGKSLGTPAERRSERVS